MNMDDDELRISDIIHVLFKNKAQILILTIIGLVIGIVMSIAGYARGEIAKRYAVNTSIAVTSVTEDGLFTTNSRNPNSVDFYLAENMVDSVMYVLRSDTLLNDAIARSGLVGISVSDVTNNLSMKQYNETQIIDITLYWRNAEEGVRILNAINEAAPDILIKTLKIGGLSVVNAPTARYLIGGNVNAKLWVYIAAAGFLLGCGISVLRMLLSPTLLQSTDMEDKLGIPLLGEIPESKTPLTQRTLITSERYDIADQVSESFFSTAHILRSTLADSSHKVIYVTSTTQSEGKSFVAAHLALYLSKMEKKVLLIDFDVRNPSIGSMFFSKVPYVRSINALYRGDSIIDEAITSVTPHLDVLPALIERNPLPLDDAMLQLVKPLFEQYDYVMMDTAPVGITADPMRLNGISESVVFVVKYDSTKIKDIDHAIKTLDKSGVRISGCVVNGVKNLGNINYPYSPYGVYGKAKRTYKQKGLKYSSVNTSATETLDDNIDQEVTNNQST